jgi:hypothetical protein
VVRTSPHFLNGIVAAKGCARRLASAQQTLPESGEQLISAGRGEAELGEQISKASDRRLVRPTLRGALLGLEIGTSRATLPVGASRFGRTPHIALSGAFLALRASDCRLAVSVGFRAEGAIGTQEEPARFRRKLRAWRVLRCSSPVKRKCRPGKGAGKGVRRSATAARAK